MSNRRLSLPTLRWLSSWNENLRPDATPAFAVDRTAIYYAGAALFYVILTVATEFHWILSGEMWAETASNYFVNAGSPNWITRFFALDSGYIPLPQRLIALVVHLLGIRAAVVPYVFDGATILFGGLLLATFCNRIFRPLAPNDFARFLFCIGICFIPDWETRTFVNFTYFGVLFVALLIAIAVVPDAADAPPWAWLAPFLMLSKPYELALFPLLVGAITVAKPRFRAIFAACIAAALAQVFTVLTSAHQGTYGQFQTEHTGLVSKAVVSVLTTFGMVSEFVLGPALSWVMLKPPMFLTYGLGGLITVLFLWLAVRRPSAASILVFGGICIVFITAVIDSFTMPSVWNLDTTPLRDMPSYRHVISAIFGATLALFGAAQLAAARWPKLQMAGRLPVPWLAAFGVAWLFVSAWPLATRHSFAPHVSAPAASNWEHMASEIDAGTPLCVPVAPYFRAPEDAWLFMRGCVRLNRPSVSHATVSVTSGAVDVGVPAEASNAHILGAAVVPKRDTRHGPPLELRLVLADADGRQIVLRNENHAPFGDGPVLLAPEKDSPPITGPVSARLSSSTPIDLRTDARGAPAVIWYGNGGPAVPGS